jgi:hypothetical protein
VQNIRFEKNKINIYNVKNIVLFNQHI